MLRGIHSIFLPLEVICHNYGNPVAEHRSKKGGALVTN